MMATVTMRAGARKRYPGRFRDRSNRRRSES
jgi:hypothetical protein